MKKIRQIAGGLALVFVAAVRRWLLGSSKENGRSCSPRHDRLHPDVRLHSMGYLTCCKDSSWVPERDLPHAEGFEYLMGKCSRCGAPWMNVFCVASGITGYERVTPGDVEAIRSIQDGPELKDFMRR